MTDYPPAFNELVEALRQLPSVGPRSAERYALHLLQADASVSEKLARALTAAKAEIHPCKQCGFYAQGLDALCSICSSTQRDTTLWCVVEQASDVIKLEKSNFFRGLYHVLGGRLSPLDRVGPEDLSIAKMEKRLTENPPTEAVLALAADAEGETTALPRAHSQEGRRESLAPRHGPARRRRPRVRRQRHARLRALRPQGALSDGITEGRKDGIYRIKRIC
jgi:recombination protein RecR